MREGGEGGINNLLLEPHSQLLQHATIFHAVTYPDLISRGGGEY